MSVGKPTSARKLSDAIIAKRYLDLRLPDEVQKAEVKTNGFQPPNPPVNPSKHLPRRARADTAHLHEHKVVPITMSAAS
jgi:hypothetical protein